MTTDSGARLTADGIYEELRERICLLDLEPGTPLREQWLAADFGVSRTPIREALTMLRLDGLVTRRPGGGAFVSTVDFKSIRDIYALRMKLAELTFEFMVSPSPLGVVEELRAIRVDVAATADAKDIRLLGSLYNRFHAALLSTVGNVPLRAVSDGLFRQTSRVWVQMLPEMSWPEEVGIVLEEIDQSIEALEDGDAVRLGEVRAKHMTMLLDRFNAYLRRPLL